MPSWASSHVCLEMVGGGKEWGEEEGEEEKEEQQEEEELGFLFF